MVVRRCQVQCSHSRQVSGRFPVPGEREREKKKQMSGIFLNQIVNSTRHSLETLESEYLFNDCDILFNILFFLNPPFSRCVCGVKSVIFLRRGNRATQFYISRKADFCRSSGYHSRFLIRYSSVRVLFHKPAILIITVFPQLSPEKLWWKVT